MQSLLRSEAVSLLYQHFAPHESDATTEQFDSTILPKANLVGSAVKLLVTKFTPNKCPAGCNMKFATTMYSDWRQSSRGLSRGR